MTKTTTSYQLYSDRVLIKSRRFHSLYLFICFCLSLSCISIGYEIFLFFTKQHNSTELVQFLVSETLLALIFLVILIEFNKNNFSQLKFHNNCFTLKKGKKDISIYYDKIKKIKLGWFYFTVYTDSKVIRLSPYNIERSEYILQEIQKLMPNEFWSEQKYKKYTDKLVLMDHGTKYGNFLNFASVISDPKFGAVQFILILIPLVVFKLQDVEFSLRGDSWFASSLISYLGLFIAVNFVIPWVLLIIYKIILTSPEGKLNKIYPAGKAKIFALTRFALNSLLILGYLLSTYIYGHNLTEDIDLKYQLPSKDVQTKIVVDYRINCFECFSPLRVKDFAYVDYISELSVVRINSKPNNEGFVSVTSIDDYQEFFIHESKILGKVFFSEPKRQKEILEYIQ